MLERKLEQHRECIRWEKVIRQIRIRIFDYEDESPAKYKKALRILRKCKAKCRPHWKAIQHRIQNDRLQKTPQPLNQVSNKT